MEVINGNKREKAKWERSHKLKRTTNSSLCLWGPIFTPMSPKLPNVISFIRSSLIPSWSWILQLLPLVCPMILPLYCAPNSILIHFTFYHNYIVLHVLFSSLIRWGEFWRWELSLTHPFVLSTSLNAWHTIYEWTTDGRDHNGENIVGIKENQQGQ